MKDVLMHLVVLGAFWRLCTHQERYICQRLNAPSGAGAVCLVIDLG